jgi:hypothetical protein
MLKKAVIFLFFFILLFICIISAISFFSKSQKIEIFFKNQDGSDGNKAVSIDNATNKVSQNLELTLDQKIGQLFIVSIKGKEVDPETEDFIKNYHPGGVLLLGENIGDETQLKKLVFDLQKISLNDTGLQLFIFISQEVGFLISGYKTSIMFSDTNQRSVFIDAAKNPKESIDAYREKVKNGEISQEKIAESLNKILKIKQGIL